MNDYHLKALDNFSHAILYYKISESAIIFSNKKAKEYFENQSGSLVFEEIFPKFSFPDVIKEHFSDTPTVTLPAMPVCTSKGVIKKCDVKITQADDCNDVFMFALELENPQETEKEEQLEFLVAMQGLTEDFIYWIDVDTMALNHISNAEKLQKFGRKIPDYVNALVSNNFVHPDDCERYVQGVIDWIAGKVEELTIRFALVSDDFLWYNVKSKKIFDENGNLVKVYGRLVNIQREKELKTAYSMLNQYFSAMQEMSEDFIYRIDAKTNTLYHTHEGTRVQQYKLGMPDYLNTLVNEGFVHPDDVERYKSEVADWYFDKLGAKDEIIVRFRLDGDEYLWYSMQNKKLYDNEGNFVEIFGKAKDIQWKKDLETRANIDLLTEVYNKSTFTRNVGEFLENAEEGQKHALMFIDLDDFKGVNDTYGHLFGDVLLTTVGKRLNRLVRDVDYVGRLGGDEFSVFVKNIESEEAMIERGKCFLESLHRKFGFEGQSMTIRASIGIAVFPQHGKTYEELLKNSDLALYHSKGEGKDLVSIYKTDMKDSKYNN